MSQLGLIIPILALSIPIVAIVSNALHKRRELELKHGGGAADQAESANLRLEIRELKERIQVLERVITDTNSATALDREIEKLR